MDIIIYEDNPKYIDYLIKIINRLNQSPELKNKLHIAIFTDNYWTVVEHIETCAFPCIYLIDIVIGENKTKGFELAKAVKTANADNRVIYITENLDLLACNSSAKIHFDCFIDKDISNVEQDLKAYFIEKGLTLESNLFYRFRETGIGVCFLAFDDIYYFEKQKAKGRINICHSGGISSFKGSLVNVRKELDGRFIFCHRAYIVNSDKIIETVGNRLTGKYHRLINGYKCPCR